MKHLKVLPVGEQYFPKLILEHYQYVDKTELLWRMITNGSGYFFARPRRFGKSLLTSTLAALFRGEKELFTSLWLGQQDYIWPQYPVIQLDFSEVYAQSGEMTKSSLNRCLADIAVSYGQTLELDSYPAASFIRLIRLLDQGAGVVVLIDEYDKPIVNQLENALLSQINREILSDFFSVIKSQSAHIRFAFVTGVSKFAKVSLFSGMNNLIDISLEPAYATLAGISEKEIEHYYGGHFAAAAQQRSQTPEAIRELVRKWYNGYRFGRDDSTEKVYNPVSLHRFLSSCQLSNYWFGTATPTFAIELIRKHNYSVPNLETNATIGMALEENHDSEQLDVLALLFQTGYLTIAAFDEKTLTYRLAFPNEEVRLSFYDHLFKTFIALEPSALRPIADGMKQALAERDLETFFMLFNQLLDEIPYPIQIHKEAYYHSLILIVLRTLDLEVQAEVVTSRGRLDLMLSSQETLYIFEFKIDSSAESALQQIEARGYGTRYQRNGKTITLVGVNFDRQRRAIDAWCQKVLS